MKLTMKILTLILALAMVFSLCACDSGSSYDDDDEDDDRAAELATPVTEVTDPTEALLPDAPTAQEQAVLDAYCENLYNFWLSSDPVEQDVYYQQLKALDLSAIDRWKNTEFEPVEYRYHKINWDYKAVFEAICVVENVMLHQKANYTDFIGNVTEDYYYPSWSYNADGTVSNAYSEAWAFELIVANPAGLSGNREYTYNDAGQLTEVRYGSYRGSTLEVTHLVSLTYDAAGNKVKETITDRNGDSFDVLYTYDEENRLVRIDCNDHYPSTYEYTYSDDGKLVTSKRTAKAGCQYDDTMVLCYDEAGNLVSGVMTHDIWSNDFFASEQHIERTRENQYTFTCDEEGRITQVDIVYGDEVYTSGMFAGDVSSEAPYALKTMTIAYGNYFVFDADQLFTIN